MSSFTQRHLRYVQTRNEKLCLPFKPLDCRLKNAIIAHVSFLCECQSPNSFSKQLLKFSEIFQNVGQQTRERWPVAIAYLKKIQFTHKTAGHLRHASSTWKMLGRDYMETLVR